MVCVRRVSTVVVGGSVGRDRGKGIELEWNCAPKRGFPVSALRMNRSEGDSVSHRNIRTRSRRGRSSMGGKRHGQG